jgi:hypothetical protein
VAKDDAPHRVERLARIRSRFEPRKRGAAMVCADELDSQWWPKVGWAWRPPVTQLEVMPPAQHRQPYLAGALDLATGTLPHGLWPRQTNALFRDLLARREADSPADRSTRLSVVVEKSSSHHATAVEQWLAAHPRVTLLWLPTYCPRANPIARAVGEVHDLCTRHSRRRRLRDLVADVETRLPVHDPWQYTLSQVYDEPDITAAVETIAAEEQAKVAA